MACKTAFPGYFEAVFEHGGDPNLIKNGIISNQTPLFTLIEGAAQNKKEKCKLLLKNGPVLDHLDGTGMTATMAAVGRGYYDIALMFLDAGADPRIYQSNQLQKLSHVMVRQESTHLKHATTQQRADYHKIAKWLEDHGESLDEARDDLKRWASWNNASGESRRKMDAEIASRKAKEAREKAAAANKANPNDE